MNVFGCYQNGSPRAQLISIYSAIKFDRFELRKAGGKKLLFIMNFVGLLTTFLFVGAIIYGIVGSQLDNVYMESVIVQSPVLRILSRNHTRIPSVAIN